MVRVGLVEYVEEQLERDISRGRLPRSGQLGSERVLARIYGVSRGTVREALRRLAARGLVVQRSGRRARPVALDESLTLENLGLALHDERSEKCRRLLEGFFSLKRQVLVELLADCCARASKEDLRLLEGACFRLWDAAKWHPGARCAQLEFELLRLAARVAERPGHLLLIQSLQWALRGNASRLRSLMGGESLRQWVTCAMNALSERDVRALQHELPVLLKACDERVLDDFAPVTQEQESPEAGGTQEGLLGDSTSASAQDDALEARPCVEEHGLGDPTSVSHQDDAREEHPCVEAHGPGSRVAAAGDTEALGGTPCPHGEALPLEPDSGALLFPAAPGPAACEPGEECTGGGGTDAALGNLSDCRAGWSASSPEREPPDQASTLPIPHGEAKGERAASWPPGTHTSG
ncbi:FadR/GntR family transcriptional regulator [Corallococcus carmarthensis]|uniref:FadR/GntR family transcriptional regulator n=1 Tax=Corallococcus carmarthensis TaxID=2316728 RepID=UPI00148B82DF|nr:GntR family transcriptional regulator [Corallococcus carmarthensis]NOK19610.1 FadR family transcriptional regulator [Corallococcus carmarthensis]